MKIDKSSLPDPKEHLDFLEKFTDAQDAFYNKQYNDAISIFKNIIKEVPSCNIAKLMLGEAYVHIGELDQAVEYFKQTETLFPEITLMNIADINRRRNQLADAIEIYKKIISRNKYFLEAYLELADTLLQENRLNEAAEMLLKAERLKINEPRLRLTQARLYFLKRDYAQSKNYIKELLRINPANADAYALLAEISVQEGKIKEAIINYRKAISIVPTRREWLIELAKLYLKPGFLDKQEAAKLYRRALELEPDAPAAAEIKKILSNIEN
jgi:tetratricopeptide (TPR) repeat protein